MTVRLIFAFLFQWTVSAAGRVLAWIIPDRPRSLDLKIKRQEYLAKVALRNYKIKTGKRKAERDVVDDISEDEDDVGAATTGETSRSPHRPSSAPYAMPDSDNADENGSNMKNRKKREDFRRSAANNSRSASNNKINKAANSVNRKSSLPANSHHIDIMLNDGKENATESWHRNDEPGNSQTLPNGRGRERKTSRDRKKTLSQQQKQQRPSSWNGNNTEMQDLKDGNGCHNNTLPSASPSYSYDYLTQML